MRITIVLACGLALLAAIVLVRSALVSSAQLDVEPVKRIELDAEAAVQRLAGAIRFETISYQDRDRVDRAEFLRFHRYLEQAFPTLHAELVREVVADFSLLYTWPGAAKELAPVLLMGHMDVVPVDPGTRGDWTHPPFAGVVADEFVWGRGTIDMKQAVTGYLEAVEWLIGQGFRPRRTVYLALHHDEEIGGRDGAASIAGLLAKRGVRLAFTLDEGSVITEGIVPGVTSPAALVAVAEKGHLTLTLTATGEGGHSSQPPRESAIGRLGRAVYRLESRQMPAVLRFPASGIFDYLAAEMPFLMRTVVTNRWLFEPLLLSRLEAGRATNAVVRTTTAPTMLREAGIKENVLATQATGIVNFRLLPGDAVDDVLRHVRTAIDDPLVAVEILGHPQQASPVSDATSPEFVALNRTIRQVFPDAVVAPSLVIGGTDSKHYESVADNSYRFLPIRMGPADLERIHGRDERIAIAGYLDSIRFYVQLLRNTAGTAGEAGDNGVRH